MGVAAEVAKRKLKYPQDYCPAKNCLWNTKKQGGGYCPRHKYLDTPTSVAFAMSKFLKET